MNDIRSDSPIGIAEGPGVGNSRADSFMALIRPEATEDGASAYVSTFPALVAALRAVLDAKLLESNAEAALLQRHDRFCSDSSLERFACEHHKTEGKGKGVPTRKGTNLAASHLLAHLAWREEFQCDGALLTEDFGDMVARREMFWLNSPEAGGHPVLVWDGSRHKVALPSTGDGTCGSSANTSTSTTEPTPERYLRFFVYLLETGQRMYFGGPERPGTFCLVVKCKGMGRRNVNLAMARLCAPVLDKHYPNRLELVDGVALPSVVALAWRAASAFVDPATVRKVCLCRGFGAPVLRQHFSAAQVADLEAGRAGPPALVIRAGPPALPTHGATQSHPQDDEARGARAPEAHAAPLALPPEAVSELHAEPHAFHASEPHAKPNTIPSPPPPGARVLEVEAVREGPSPPGGERASAPSSGRAANPKGMDPEAARMKAVAKEARAVARAAARKRMAAEARENRDTPPREE